MLHTKRPATHPGPPAADEPGDLATHQRLALAAEQMFLKHDLRTLTDPDTAEAYLITLRLFDGMLQGALATGVLNEDQYRDLAATIEGMKAAPTLLG